MKTQIEDLKTVIFINPIAATNKNTLEKEYRTEHLAQYNTIAVSVCPNQNKLTLKDSTHASGDRYKKSANACLIFGILSWITYLTVLLPIICAVISWKQGVKSRRIFKTKRAKTGMILSGLLLGTYSLFIILVLITSLFL